MSVNSFPSVSSKRHQINKSSQTTPNQTSKLRRMLGLEPAHGNLFSGSPAPASCGPQGGSPLRSPPPCLSCLSMRGIPHLIHRAAGALPDTSSFCSQSARLHTLQGAYSSQDSITTEQTVLLPTCILSRESVAGRKPRATPCMLGCAQCGDVQALQYAPRSPVLALLLLH